jgi:hypothetical protein
MTAFRRIPDVAVGKSFIVFASVGPNRFDRLMVALASDFWRSEGQQIRRRRRIARPSIRATLAPWMHRTLPSASALYLLKSRYADGPPPDPRLSGGDPFSEKMTGGLTFRTEPGSS